MASQANANPIAVIRQNLTQMAPELKAALPEHVSVEKFTRVAMTAIQQMLVPLMQDMERDIDAELDKQGDAPGEPPAVLDTPPAAR